MHPEAAPPLTADEHRELEEEIREMRARLRPLCDLVANVYGVQSRAARSFKRTLEAIEMLDADLRQQAETDRQR